MQRLTNTLLLTITCIHLMAQIGKPELQLDGIGDDIDVEIVDLDGDGQFEILYSGGDFEVISQDPIITEHYGGILLYRPTNDTNDYRFIGERIFNNRVDGLTPHDIDFDGDLDFLTRANFDWPIPYQVGVIYNGGGELATEIEMFPSVFPDRETLLLKSTDLNGDGINDLLTINNELNDPDTIKYWLGGNDTYTPYMIYERFFGDIRYTDMDGDGRQDIVLFNEYGGTDSLFIYRFNAENVFEKIDIYPFREKARTVSIQDFDNNGFSDILYSRKDSDQLYIDWDIIEKKGSDTSVIGSISTTFNFYFLDYNFDGYQDFIEFHDTENNLFTNNGDRTFTTVSSPFEISSGASFVKLIPDEENQSHQLFYELEGIQSIIIDVQGNIESKRPKLSSFAAETIDDAEAADINGDGYPELIFASRFAHAIGYLTGTPIGPAGDFQFINEEMRGPSDLQMGDYNKDGHLDIVYGSIWNYNVMVEYGDGQGNFTGRSELVSDHRLLHGMEVADFNGDGYEDVVATSFLDSAILMVRNINGQFQSPDTILNGYQYFDIVVYDVDGDGDMDVIPQIKTMYNASFYIALNDGNGNFTQTPEDIPHSIGMKPYVLDIDDDGTKELVLAGQGGVGVHRPNKIGELEMIATFNLEAAQRYYAPLDYNGDSIIDILSWTVDDEVLIYLNDGSLNFTYYGLYSDDHGDEAMRILGPNPPFVVDYDLDGDRDIFFSHRKQMYRITNYARQRGIEGHVFWDRDEDANFDTDESGIGNIKVSAKQNGEIVTSTFTRNPGNYTLFVPPGMYTIEAEALNECWEPIGGISNQEVDFSSGNPVNVNFGMVNLNGEEDIDLVLSRAATRCGFTVRYYVTAKNSGCGPVYGELIVELDDLVNQFYSFNIENVNIEGNRISVPIDELLPGESFDFNFLVTVPGVEFFGEVISDLLTLNYNIDGGDTYDLQTEATFKSDIRCAVDPNDKLIHPDRSEEFGDAYITDEELIYTIRFQNTGNDTAFNVQLVDTLAESLDLRSFKVLASSHPYRLELDEEERIIQVFYDNILLPDSTVNQLESNGFFSFAISPAEGLDEFSPVKNGAAIYFDFNPAVITNQTKSIYVSDLSTVSVENPAKVYSLTIFPSPTSGLVHIKSDVVFDRIEVIDVTGKQCLLVFGDQNILDLSFLPEGIFFIRGMIGESVSKARIVIQK